jgi:hypothetical protein
MLKTGKGAENTEEKSRQRFPSEQCISKSAHFWEIANQNMVVYF